MIGKYKLSIIILLTSILLSGCASYKKTIYLQNEAEMKPEQGQLYDFRIMPKDKLQIVISTTDPQASAPFYRKIGQDKENPYTSQYISQQGNLLEYLVDNQGYIEMPVLGRIFVSGKTTRECEGTIRELLKPYLKETPLVTVNTSNFKISILGEVNRPGTYTISNEKVTIFEALALSGDLTLNSVRDDVQLLREDEQGRRRIIHLNLNESSITNSPYFYLQQNDVLYVKPNKARVRNNEITTNTSAWFTLLSMVTSVTSLILAITR